MFRALKELRKYPSAIFGLVILVIFISVSIVTVFALPHDEAVRLWRAGPGVWEDLPRRAQPVWFDLFTREAKPRTIIVTLDDNAIVTSIPTGTGSNQIGISFPFEYNYDGFPKELSIFTEATFQQLAHNFAVYMRKPNGELIPLDESRRFTQSSSYRISQDINLRMALGAIPHVGLFVDNPRVNTTTSLKGSYEVLMQGELPEGSQFNSAKLVVYGQVHGLAGTDHLRRDLMVAMLWGAPIGLLFGVLAAIGAQLSTFVLAGIGTWFGGKLDALFHRLTEITMILPLLALLIMVGHFYSRSIWVMLGMVILLNIFSASMKVYRAMFLQAKEAAYIEAAKAYGAGNFRIIFQYLLPRLTPILLPQFVTVIPLFVFLEATLAVLGLGDPNIPTWGKVIYDARANDALYMGDYYWMILPAILLMLIGFGFALLGYALDRILNPRLRSIQ